MFKKLLLVLAILFPSALYLYIVSRDDNEAPVAEQTQVPATSEAEYQTPDH
ncbi:MULTISPECIES: hypothetical protein [unclassified Acinetobacter]|uniref:hypothetical protein n=1 Tax=unclassified Acinetobacter TaxID=196816 RepID=UPI0015D3A4D2|nr:MULTISPECIES: hypothetical protein [unclassified Acinetobacter]